MSDIDVADSNSQAELPNRINSDAQSTPPKRNSNRNRDSAVSDNGDDDALDPEELRYGAEQTMSLLVPVSLCMMVVILTVRSIQYYGTAQETSSLAFVVSQESTQDTGAKKFSSGLLNALVFIGIITAMTLLLVLLYKYKCYKVIYAWLVFVSCILLFLFSYLYLNNLMDAINSTTDYITIVFALWNFGAAGIVSIYWKSPIMVQQVYLIITSSLIALVFVKELPDYTAWILLSLMAVYDLIAVLAPCGPLKMFIETAQERNEVLPGLLYTASVVWIATMATPPNERDPENSAPIEDDSIEMPNTDATSSTAAIATQPRGSSVAGVAAREEPTGFEVEREGVKLGLGDFIFYSVLVGKAALDEDLSTTFACFFAILMGLCGTLLLLAIARKALPALPVSIALGIVFYFVTSRAVVPYLETITTQQVFI